MMPTVDLPINEPIGQPLRGVMGLGWVCVFPTGKGKTCGAKAVGGVKVPAVDIGGQKIGLCDSRHKSIWHQESGKDLESFSGKWVAANGTWPPVYTGAPGGDTSVDGAGPSGGVVVRRVERDTIGVSSSVAGGKRLVSADPQAEYLEATEVKKAKLRELEGQIFALLGTKNRAELRKAGVTEEVGGTSPNYLLTLLSMPSHFPVGAFLLTGCRQFDR